MEKGKGKMHECDLIKIKLECMSLVHLYGNVDPTTRTREVAFAEQQATKKTQCAPNEPPRPSTTLNSESSRLMKASRHDLRTEAGLD